MLGDVQEEAHGPQGALRRVIASFSVFPETSSFYLPVIATAQKVRKDDGGRLRGLFLERILCGEVERAMEWVKGMG